MAQCLSNTLLQEFQTLLDVNIFFFPLREIGGQHYWLSLAAREAKHVKREWFVQKKTVTVLGRPVLHLISSRLSCCFRLELIVKTLDQAPPCKGVGGGGTVDHRGPFLHGVKICLLASFVPHPAGLKLGAPLG